MSVTLAAHLCEAQKLNHTQDKYRFSIFTASGIKFGVDLARNTIVKHFLGQPTFDRLWMIDEDITPEEDVFQILDLDADIVAPMMPVMKFERSEGKFSFDLAYAAGNFTDINDLSTEVEPDLTKGKPVEVDMVGTGCTVIRRAVLEDKRMWFNDDDLEEGDPPPVFRYHKKSNGSHRLGEDADFSVRARKLGYKIMLHTGVFVGHMRWVDLQNIFMMRYHYAQQAAQAV